jgi:uncharacterized alkaline shock family protein YloU
MSMTSTMQTSGRRQETATMERSPQTREDFELEHPTEFDSRPSGGVTRNTGAGSTHIGEGVVATIAGLAARDIPGVHSMGSSMARRVGQLRNLIPGSSEAVTQGVQVEVGEREAAVDLNLVTEYGQSIVDIADAVRRNVSGQVEGMTGLRVVEVNISVEDIHLESGPADVSSPQRVASAQRVQ